MNNENEQPAQYQDDENEGKTFRDAYLDAINQNRPQPRSDSSSPDTSSPPVRKLPRGVPGSASFYEEIEGDKSPRVHARHAKRARRLRPVCASAHASLSIVVTRRRQKPDQLHRRVSPLHAQIRAETRRYLVKQNQPASRAQRANSPRRRLAAHAISRRDAPCHARGTRRRLQRD